MKRTSFGRLAAAMLAHTSSGQWCSTFSINPSFRRPVNPSPSLPPSLFLERALFCLPPSLRISIVRLRASCATSSSNALCVSRYSSFSRSRARSLLPQSLPPSATLWPKCTYTVPFPTLAGLLTLENLIRSLGTQLHKVRLSCLAS